jgi:hypothetical protein
VTRIYRHTIADAPGASRPLLEGFVPFGYLALTVFTAYFVNYAQTPIDLPAGPEPAAAGVAGSGAVAGAVAGEQG